MCSIFGWITTIKYADSDRVNSVAEKVADAMESRGPDDRGWHLFSTTGYIGNEDGFIPGKCALLLGQTRLSIIDLSHAGHQPMVSPDGRYTLVYNGEIYNYRELRRVLEELGYSFFSNTDTEVLLYSYIQWGKECLDRFTGMFAFVIHDSKEGALFCARDYFGIKPFFYQTGENGFTFASEISAMLEFPGTGRKLNPQKAYEYLVFGSVDAGRETLIDGIYQLPPGHYCMVDVKTGTFINYERYWKIDLSIKSTLSFNDAAVKMRNLFLDSVKLHLRSDVPLGIALSGGIDSSAIACSIRYLYPDIPIHTFSYIAHDSEKLSEEKWIDIINNHINAVSHKVYVESKEVFFDLDKLIKRLGEPFGSTSIYAQYRVFQLARESGVIVTLDGQGADELLAGYNGFSVERLESLIGQLSLMKTMYFIWKSGKWPGRDRKAMIIHYLGRIMPDYLKTIGRIIIGKPFFPRWLNKDYFIENNIELTIKIEENIYKSREKLKKALAKASTVAGLTNLLRHGDRNSMTWSIESRVPFCNKTIAEFTLSLPEEYLLSESGLTKAVFREAMRGIVPDEILDRKDKIGFQTPEKDWFPALSAWVEPILNKAENSKLFNHQKIISNWNDVSKGLKVFDSVFWRQINYLRWKEIFNIEE